MSGLRGFDSDSSEDDGLVVPTPKQKRADFDISGAKKLDEIDHGEDMM